MRVSESFWSDLIDCWSFENDKIQILSTLVMQSISYKEQKLIINKFHDNFISFPQKILYFPHLWMAAKVKNEFALDEVVRRAFQLSLRTFFFHSLLFKRSLESHFVYKWIALQIHGKTSILCFGPRIFQFKKKKF